MNPADSSRFSRFLMLAQAGAQLASRGEYRGPNPAIAAAYAPLRAGFLVMGATTLVTLTFGALAPIESAAVAHGHVVVLSNKKTVQHLEGGIIKQIFIKDGDLVRAGQPLLELSDIAPRANHGIVRTELLVARAEEARLVALRDKKAAISFPTEMNEEAKTIPELAKAMKAQADYFAIQHESQQGKVKTLALRIAQLREEIVGLRAQVKSAEGQLALIGEEVSSVQILVGKGLAPKPRLLALQRTQEELGGNRGQYVAQIAKAEQTISETRLQIINIENEFATQLAGELREVQMTIADQEKKLRAATDVVDRTTITAPSEGIVTGLKFHTVGGVVAAGTPILDIVPQSDTLIIEAKVQPTDIDVVKPGLPSKIVPTAYKTRRLPKLTGNVTQVSADRFTDQNGLESSSYYLARVEVDKNELARLATNVRLYPGMPMDVYIRTGTRSFLGYLLAPLTDSMYSAFREE
jgi:HlyD family secretion protein